MKTSKRLRYYIIGFGLGILLTMFLFVNKDVFGFLPSNRVLHDIQNSNIMISPEEKEKLTCLGVDEAFIFSMIENAAVNFSSSQTNFSKENFVLKGLNKSIEVKKYELEYKDILLSFWIAPKDSISVLHTITKPSNCQLTQKDNKTLEILYMPQYFVF